MANLKYEPQDVRLIDGKFITNQDVCANNLDVTSNAYANYFVGSGRYLTDLPISNNEVSNAYLNSTYISNSYYNSITVTGDVTNVYLQTVLG